MSETGARPEGTREIEAAGELVWIGPLQIGVNLLVENDVDRLTVNMLDIHRDFVHPFLMPLSDEDGHEEAMVRRSDVAAVVNAMKRSLDEAVREAVNRKINAGDGDLSQDSIDDFSRRVSLRWHRTHVAPDVLERLAAVVRGQG